MSVCTSLTFSKASPLNPRRQRDRIPASGSEGVRALPEVRNADRPIKMLNMRSEPTICMKTQGHTPKQPIIRRAYWRKMHSSFQNKGNSTAHLGRLCTGKAVIGGKLAPKSTHRFIDPSIHRRSAASFFDGPMSRWSDEPIVSPFHYVLANKAS